MKKTPRAQDILKNEIPALAKLTPPQLPPVLERTRLFEEFDRLREWHRVIWIQGPPGAGKTTLVASYLQARKLKPLWYQLDEGDADPGTWFRYLSLGMKQVASRFKKPLPSLSPEYLPGITVFTRRFFEQLYSRLKAPGVVVFDNYQDVGDGEQFHDLMSVALSTIPEETTVIIVSREHSPENFSRLQAEQQLVILAPGSLQLTLTDTKDFLRLRGGRVLQTEQSRQAEIFHARTQGWLAGMVLLLNQFENRGISLAETDTQEVAPVVFEYFASQVFQTQPQEKQDFLLRTAFLSSMTASMAEQVTGDSKAKHYLSELARSQYFTERHLGNEPLYQYHPLFQSFLRKRIQETWKPGDIRELQQRTARVLGQTGRYEDAFRLFQESKDRTEVVRLIVTYAPDLLNEGRSQTVERWISSLPVQVKNEHPWIIFWQAQCQVLTNPNEGAKIFEQAFDSFQNARDPHGIYLSWCGVVEAVIRSWERLPRLERWIDQLSDLEVQYAGYPNPEIEARVAVNMFNALVWCRLDDPMVYRWEAKALEVLEHIPEISARMPVLCFLHTFRTHLGEISMGEGLLKRAESWIKERRVSPFAQAMFCVMEAVQGWLMSDLDRSARASESGLALARHYGFAFVHLPLLDQGVTAAVLQRDLQLAKLFAKEHWAIAQCLTGINKASSHHLQGWIAFIDGEHDEAFDHFREAQHLYHIEGHLFLEGLVHWMLGQLQIERGNYKASQKHLSELEVIIERFPSAFLQTFVCMLKALWHEAQGRTSEGRTYLREWLRLSRTHQIVLCQGSMPHLYARLAFQALEADIEVTYTRQLIAKMSLDPEHPLLTSDLWPWPVKIYALGRFLLTGEAGVVHFGRKVPKGPLSLVKLLIVSGGHEVSQSFVLDRLWPDADGDFAYRSMKMALSRLRKLLKREDAILFSGGTLSINSEVCWVDSLSFQCLVKQSEIEAKQGNLATSDTLAKRARSLYKGELLPYDDDAWALPVREKLQKVYVSLMKQLDEHDELQVG